MNNKKRQTVIAVIGLLGVLAIISGVTYAWFSYTKAGTEENTITAGTIKFTYTEQTNGLTMRDALPMTDAQGKAQSNYFDFKIASSTANSFSVPYTVTVRVKDESDPNNQLNPDVVKLWLSDQSNQEISDGLGARFLQDTDPTTRSSGTYFPAYHDAAMNPSDRYNERVIYTGTVPSNSTDYIKNFRLRMWIDENTDFSPKYREVTPYCSDSTYLTEETCIASSKNTWDSVNQVCSDTTYTTEADCLSFKNMWITSEQYYPYNNKQFTVTVNVYANGEVVSLDFTADQVSYTPPASATNTACTDANATLDCALDELSTMFGVNN